MFMFKEEFSFIFFNKILFFLPPPHTKISLIFSLDEFNNLLISSPIILAVKSVKVATPSSRLSPLAKDISKSLVSNDNFFLLFLFHIKLLRLLKNYLIICTN